MFARRSGDFGPHSPRTAFVTVDELRAEVERWPACRACYRLCLEAPPIDPVNRPRNLRWIIMPAGYYPQFAAAYARGRAGLVLDDDTAIRPWRGAWLAGLDTRPPG